MSTLLEENLSPSVNTASKPSFQHKHETNAKGKFHFKIRKMFLNGNTHYVYIGVDFGFSHFIGNTRQSYSLGSLNEQTW